MNMSPRLLCRSSSRLHLGSTVCQVRACNLSPVRGHSGCARHAPPPSKVTPGVSGGTGSKTGNSDLAWIGGTALFFVGSCSYLLGRHDKSKNQTGKNNPTLALASAVLDDPFQRPTKEGFNLALADLRKSIPEECISLDPDDLRYLAASPLSWHVAKCLPGAIVYPRSTEDVVRIVKIANKYAIPLTPYAGGTALEGQCDAPFCPSEMIREGESGDLPSGLSLVVNFSENMDTIIAVHDDDLDVIVQPGVKYEVLNEELKDRGTGLFFPVDPGPGAEIGGMISTGCSGTNAVRYGTMRENVLNLTVVLPNGEVMKTRQRAKKSSAGPDLGRLFIGAEGTLGLITEATLKLQPVLPYSVATTSFGTVQNAVDAVVDVVKAGIAVQCVELVDDTMIQAFNKKARSEGGKIWEEVPMLFIKFAGTEGQIKSDMDRVGSILKSRGAIDMTLAKSQQESDEIWTMRKNCHPITMDFIPGARLMATDVCVPISNLPKLVHDTKENLAKAGLTGPIVGHVGDGNFHAGILISTDEELKKAKDVVRKMVATAQRLEGTCTGEHGVGTSKREYLENELGKTTVGLLRKIKELIDPKNIMNPGKLLPEVDSRD